MDPDEIHSSLFGFQKDVALWALKTGRAALFLDCGLGKCRISLEWARMVCQETDGDVLVLAPLAVSHQFKAEAEEIGIGEMVTVCRDQSDVRDGINVTNYERLHLFDGKFSGVVLDESSILKAHDGKTKARLIERFERVEYKLCCTATPAPNDHIELGNHAQFLGVMSSSEMLSMFFVHDGGSTQNWRLKGHAKDDFWAWMCSWAIHMRMPSDLGYDDDGFVLPPLNMTEHIVENSNDVAREAGMLFNTGARTLNEQRAARRESMTKRVSIAADMANDSDEPWILWCDLNAESTALAKAIPDAVEVRGSDSVEKKEDALIAFTKGDIRVLVTKASIAGWGMNWQHCSHTAFVGVSHSFEQWYQAVRRVYRFGQKSPVDCHVITSEAEGDVLKNLKRKQVAAEELATGMIENTKDITKQNLVTQGIANSAAYNPDTPMALPPWAGETVNGTQCIDQRTGSEYGVYQGDCVDVLKGIPDESVHYSIFSPPFADLYVYSNNERDMGNCKGDGEFLEHLGYMIRELYRVIMPGRLISFHCMDLPTTKFRDGFIGIRDFRGALISAFQEAGWIFHSTVVIWKDPVTAMQRTKALGLLHKQIKKDSCMSRQGIPDYLITMRKPGDNPERVTHTNESFPVQKWQNYASPVWMDINPSDTLQKTSAREHNDERHICPLQLDVIRRAVELWTNPGDTVLSPYAGIGSEGYVSVQDGRRFIGVELKESYFKQAVKNLANAVKQQELF